MPLSSQPKKNFEYATNAIQPAFAYDGQDCGEQEEIMCAINNVSKDEKESGYSPYSRGVKSSPPFPLGGIFVEMAKG